MKENEEEMRKTMMN